jgi:catechol 1,2-dioxygenase
MSSSHNHLHHFDRNFTQNVINATGPQASPRIRQVVGGLVQHLHDFMRENLVTMDEFMAAIELVSQLRIQ